MLLCSSAKKLLQFNNKEFCMWGKKGISLIRLRWTVASIVEILKSKMVVVLSAPSQGYPGELMLAEYRRNLIAQIKNSAVNF